MNKFYILENKSSKELIDLMAKDCCLSNYEIVKNSNGKPYFKDVNIYFSLSHKDNIIVGITSSKAVGIDIERMTFRPSVVRRFFTANEEQQIKKSDDAWKTFTTIWVKKEAILKMYGYSLSEIRKIDTTSFRKYQIKEYKNYIIGIVEE